MHDDVVVIGGGPAGSRAARLLSRDYDVTVLEDHPVSGIPVQCTGLITQRVVELSGVKPNILNELYGANVHFPNGGVISARSGRSKALLVERSDLDVRMAHAAQDAGAKYAYSERYMSHRIEDGAVKLKTTSGKVYDSTMIIGADGQNSKVSMSLDGNLPKEYVRGIQVDLKHEMDDQKMIDIYIGAEIAPGFFSWEIPFGEYTRVGLCTAWSAGPPVDYMKVLLKRTGLEGKEVVGRVCGKIPIGGRRRTYDDNMLLIGDAAGQVKPVSGGGLYPSFMAAPCLKKTVDAAFESEVFTRKRLSIYERKWKKAVGKELKRGYRLRKMYDNLSDDDLNNTYDVINREDVTRVLNDIDIDSPSDVVPIVLRNIPVAMRMLPILLRSLI
ncbi:MAG: NAD(P)/FAD-dependent oxidoreductase [Candidatus Methanomethylophilaceae archaeon]